MTAVAESIHTLADLSAWSFSGVALAVIGHPIAHSLSPVIHNAALAELARTQPRFRDWRYFKFDIAPADLPAGLAAFHRLNFHGLNLTVPHKSLVMDHLTKSDAFVRAAGAANTLVYFEDGWHGANTDGYGLTTSLQQELAASLAGANVILLGAGGAARGAAVECLRARCTTLWIGNRTATTLTTLLDELAPLAGSTELHGFDLTRPATGLPTDAIVINATSLGLGSSDPAPIDLKLLPRPKAVFDMIYRPAQTALLRQAAELGLAQANGLSMLVHQGARSLEIWTGTTVPVAVMQAAAQSALGLSPSNGLNPTPA
jgi:shikimate dehydrogenase